MNKVLNKILLLIGISFCFTINNAFASDNVLQAIQIDGVKDSYNVILKSDDVAEVKKTVQAPNKMILNLKGIRASKTINTIYNNTSSVDSVVVEPTSDDSVKISIQADNVGSAEIHFDSLKTPLGVLGNTEKKNNAADELVLNAPMESYKPVYDNSSDNEDAGFSFAAVSQSAAKHLKNVLKNDKISWTLVLGLFSIVLLSGLKTIKGKDNEIKVGLSQSLKERELELYRGGVNLPIANEHVASAKAHHNVNSNYGLKAYQNGTRSPYLTQEIQRTRPVSAPVAQPQQINSQYMQQTAKVNVARPSAQNLQGQNTTMNSNSANTLKITPGIKPKTTNIDSIKFLESMTKIYEKNGRSDLAQGLKSNMKKAKASLA